MRTLRPILQSGAVCGFEGLEEGEVAKIIPFGLIAEGIITEDFAEWLYDNEPLKDKVVVVVACNVGEIVKHRSEQEFDFSDPIVSGNTREAERELRPRTYPTD